MFLRNKIWSFILKHDSVFSVVVAFSCLVCYRIISSPHMVLTFFLNISQLKHSTLCIKTKWEKALDEEISAEIWYEMWKCHQTTTQSQKLKKFAWKNQIRYFITPLITSKQLWTPQPCWRQCGDMSPNHTHIFWSCKKNRTFLERGTWSCMPDPGISNSLYMYSIIPRTFRRVCS